jgi:hypothetical protein
MRSAYLGITLVLASTVVCAGGAAQQFASGYGGVSWGMSVADVVGMMPNGNLYFTLPEGARDYIVKNDEPLLGVSRSGQTLQYHFGVDGRVDQIEVHIAYDSREQLLGAMISQFGNYYLKRDYGSTTTLYWIVDQKVSMGLRTSNDPRYGIAEFFVIHSGTTRTKAGAN